MQARRSFDSVESVVRLLNIDYSHLRVWRHALATGASAALVIEDDAQLVDERLGEFLAALLPHIKDHSVLVNCSRSISVDDLGITQILREATMKLQLQEVRVTQTDRAITNTVCANLYSHEFLERLVAFIDRRGLVPVVPIDWRVNEFLLDNPETKTWWVDPAPFVQGSMHDMS
jgi:GR25 family glycosyltransferase involved in LPS biosynthesis